MKVGLQLLIICGGLMEAWPWTKERADGQEL